MNIEEIKQRFKIISPFMNEKQKRLFAATEATIIGHGGRTIVSRTIGMSRDIIAIGCKELKEENNPDIIDINKVRKEGGGRKSLIYKDATLLKDLDSIIEPVTYGDPESPLRWTSKSLRNLSEALNEMGHRISHTTVGELLHELGYSLQVNQKALEETCHEDRDEQFEHINERVKEYQSKNQPVISVDTKKKELVGDFKNGGSELRPKGKPEKVRCHDFMIKELGKVSPYGIYDITNNIGSVNVGISHDTAEFAVESIRRWWYSMGKETYPSATELLITPDSGGSNGYRGRLWKVELQKLAHEIGLTIEVSHFPPGTSKWNKIEHRLFSSISQNWRGKPLISHEVIINLIGSTTTKTGLKVNCQLDDNTYQKGIKISDEDMAKINITRDDFHGEWNYKILPSYSIN
jgi:transposase